MIDRISGPSIPNSTMTQTVARPTPTPERTGAVFSLDAVAKGANAAVSALPGGAQLAAAVRGPMTPMSLGVTSGPVGGGGMSPQGPTLGGGNIVFSAGVGTPGMPATVGVGGTGTTGSVDPSAGLIEQEQQLLNEQVAIQGATEQFTMQSNVLNAEHQAKEGALQNLRA